jgi:hypothetical protein
MSSISLSEFPGEDEVIAFYQLIESNLRRYSLNDVLAWRYQDIEYLKNKKLSTTVSMQLKDWPRLRALILC